ncbi:MAG: PD-(D/E)XK nuclease domain-containing protein [Saprospiraceae bacterium]
MKRFFNTAGPNQPADHYTLNPLTRLTTVRELIENKRYFILHAPRQTGKTTTMLRFVEAINQEGKYIALYINVEPAQAVRTDVAAANRVFVGSLKTWARETLPTEYRPSATCFEDLDPEGAFRDCLGKWCSELSKPLVLFIDEADSLIGDSLLSLLRQLRSGYPNRPAKFPHSLSLIGLRDVRDFRIYSELEKRYEIGGSAFNIKDKSLTMGNFTPENVRDLYAQHTAETGQQFSEEALNLIFEQTQGQPWLVNALGRELCFEEHKVLPEGRTIVPEDVQKAIETLIQRRDVHLDNLQDKLTERRVAVVVDAIMGGGGFQKLAEIPKDDLQFCLDLGLVTKSPNGLVIANPIYREVIPRELSSVHQDVLPVNPAWFVRPENGKLDIEKVLSAFFEFYRENSEMLPQQAIYPEATYHLAFMAWLQRIVNGGGYIRREYAAGLGFIDLVIHFAGEKFVFELKTEANFKRQKALDQICQYAERMSVGSGYLVVFRKGMPDPEAVGQRETVQHGGKTVYIIWV